MIVNLKCDDCIFQGKCAAYKKLKPFSEDARTDLGVEIKFLSCDSYTPIDEEENNEDEVKEEEEE